MYSAFAASCLPSSARVAVQAFQRLVWVSYGVFGPERASFLLPLTRALNVSPGTIDIARRDVAKQLFSDFLKQQGAELEVRTKYC